MYLAQQELSRRGRVCLRRVGGEALCDTYKEDELKAVVNIDGQQISITAHEAVVFTDGDFDGNIDMSIGVTPKVATETLLAHLRARVPGETALVDVIGSEEVADGLDVTFYAPALRGASSIPAAVVLEWAAQTSEVLGSVPCRKA